MIVGMISTGLFLFVYKSTSFNLIGFLMCLTASVISGARWTLSQLVMQKDKLGLENPVDMIYHIQPIMLITIIPLAAGFEGLSFKNCIFCHFLRSNDPFFRHGFQRITYRAA